MRGAGSNAPVKFNGFRTGNGSAQQPFLVLTASVVIPNPFFENFALVPIYISNKQNFFYFFFHLKQLFTHDGIAAHSVRGNGERDGRISRHHSSGQGMMPPSHLARVPPAVR